MNRGRRVYLPIAVELRGHNYEVLPAGTFNRVTVYMRTRAGLRRIKDLGTIQRVMAEVERQAAAKKALAAQAKRPTPPKRPKPIPWTRRWRPHLMFGAGFGLVIAALIVWWVS